MADRKSGGTGDLSFRQKAARVYGAHSKDRSPTLNSSIKVERGFTVKFSEEERRSLDCERSQVRDRLTKPRG